MAAFCSDATISDHGRPCHDPKRCSRRSRRTANEAPTFTASRSAVVRARLRSDARTRCGRYSASASSAARSCGATPRFSGGSVWPSAAESHLTASGPRRSKSRVACTSFDMMREDNLDVR